MPTQTAPTATPAITMIGSVSDRRRDADHRHGDRRRGEAAEHQRAFAADHDEADARGDRHRERRQDQRRGALQRVLERERGAEAAAPDISRRNRPAICRSPAGTARTAAPPSAARTAGMATYSELARSRSAKLRARRRRGRRLYRRTPGSSLAVGAPELIARLAQVIEPTTPSSR